MKNTKLLNFLRSNNFALSIAILSVVVQSFHSFTAFYNTSSLHNYWGVAQAVLFAIIIDLAIIFYTLRNRTDIARFAALAMVLINAYYYYQHLGISFEFIFGVFLSLIIPVSVYFYSEEIRVEEQHENPYHYARIIEDKDEEIDKLSNELLESQKIEKRNDERIEQTEKELINALGNYTKKDADLRQTVLSEMEWRKKYYTILDKYEPVPDDAHISEHIARNLNLSGESRAGERDYNGMTSSESKNLHSGYLTPEEKKSSDDMKVGNEFFNAEERSQIENEIKQELAPDDKSLVNIEEAGIIKDETFAEVKAVRDLEQAKKRHKLIEALQDGDLETVNLYATGEREEAEKWLEKIGYDLSRYRSALSKPGIESPRIKTNEPYKGAYKTGPLPDKNA